MDGFTKSYLDILHFLIQQILSVIHNHFHWYCLVKSFDEKSKYTLKSIFVIIQIFCIPRHGKVTQEFISLLMEN